jgi:hypothetical protein
MREGGELSGNLGKRDENRMDVIPSANLFL